MLLAASDRRATDYSCKRAVSLLTVLSCAGMLLANDGANNIRASQSDRQVTLHTTDAVAYTDIAHKLQIVKLTLYK